MPTETSAVEGYWGRDPDDPAYPWPVPSTAPWPGRGAFLDALRALEARASRARPGTDGVAVLHAKGFSLCRLCGCVNGTREFRSASWTWPEGYRHYVEEHGVRPSEGFEAYVPGAARGEAAPAPGSASA